MSATKKYVYCFQQGLGIEPPFLAELVRATAQMAELKVGKKLLKANRAACSTTPYTEEDLKKFQPHEAVGDQPVAKMMPVKKIEGFF